MKNQLKIPLFCFLFITLTGCSNRSDSIDQISMIQLVDRVGMNETIKDKERLKKFSDIDFNKPQPYQKVTRILTKKNSPQKSIITTYHENGLLKEYLESSSNRACGFYREFYSNGVMRIEAQVIEGIADLTDSAKSSYVFDNFSKVFYNNGTLLASIRYEKGKLDGESVYYYMNGKIEKKLIYKEDLLNGKALFFDENEALIGFTEYKHGVKEGPLVFYGDHKSPAFEEWYEKGLLNKAKYFDFFGNELSCIHEGKGIQTVFEDGKLKKQIEYFKGMPCGETKLFYPSGNIQSQFYILNGSKNGSEWIYFDEENKKPKLFLSWYQDELHGSQKSWYESGSLESQKEMIHNLKHGQLIAWYESGQMMLIEDYDHGKLKEGLYFSKNSKEKVSSITEGKGLATLYDKDGFYLHKIYYDKGEIVNE